MEAPRGQPHGGAADRLMTIADLAIGLSIRCCTAVTVLAFERLAPDNPQADPQDPEKRIRPDEGDPLLALGAGAPQIHDLRQLNARCPTTNSPRISDDDIDLLDPWVIDGRYAPDRPDLGPTEAGELLTAATTIVDRIRPLTPERKPHRHRTLHVTRGLVRFVVCRRERVLKS